MIWAISNSRNAIENNLLMNHTAGCPKISRYAFHSFFFLLLDIECLIFYVCVDQKSRLFFLEPPLKWRSAGAVVVGLLVNLLTQAIPRTVNPPFPLARVGEDTPGKGNLDLGRGDLWRGGVWGLIYEVLDRETFRDIDIDFLTFCFLIK